MTLPARRQRAASTDDDPELGADLAGSDGGPRVAPAPPPPAQGLPLQELLSWPPLLAVAVLALNDHLLKALYPGWWTGKLSDLAGLFYFPLFLTAAGRLVWASARRLVRADTQLRVTRLQRSHLIAACVGTALVFAAINTSADAMAGWNRLLSLGFPSRGTVDPTDLLALPMIVASYAWGLRFVARQGPQPPPTRRA